MLTIAVPGRDVATALGAVHDDVRIVIWDPDKEEAPADVRDSVDLVCLQHRVGGRRVFARLAACARLQLVQLPSAGFEHAAGLVPPGVALANARGVHDSRTAEMALLLTLASQRRLVDVVEAQQAQTWRQPPWSPSLADATVLVVGYGSIGTAIAARMRACEARVEGVARTARTAPDGTVVHASEDLPALLPRADVVVLVVPATPQTHHVADAAFLARMRDGALLVNVGRGSAVDTEALVVEVESGRLRAALDVTDPEPLPDGHPLWRAPGVIISPHIAGMEVLTDRRYTDLVHRQIASLRAGEGGVNVVVTGGPLEPAG